LKKKKVPKFCFLGKKRYFNKRNEKIDVNIDEVPYYIVKNFNLKTKKEEPVFLYFKKKEYMYRRNFDRIRQNRNRRSNKKA